MAERSAALFLRRENAEVAGSNPRIQSLLYPGFGTIGGAEEAMRSIARHQEILGP